MISISNIRHISRYESKAIKRGWFFKIAALGLVGFFSIFILTALSTIFPGTGEWDLASTAAKWPYSVMFILNMMLPFVVVFLATGLLKKNKKLDTNEVFLTRPISNADYVLGRVVAIVQPIVLIHLFIIAVLLAGNIMSEDALFNIQYYFFYPLVISVPSLTFVTGLSFLIVSIIRNQAVSLVVILAILGALLIVFAEKYYYVLDFNAGNLPLLQSDMPGLYQIESALCQRAMFFVLGIGFLALSILLVDRLPMKKSGRISAFSIGFLSLIISVALGYLYLDKTRWQPDEIRSLARSINEKMYGIENVDITDCFLDLEHTNQLKITSQLQLKNNNESAVKSYYFYLNPALKVVSITKNGQSLDYTRELHKIEVNPKTALGSGQTDEIEIKFEGSIDENIAYLGVEKERLEDAYFQEMFSTPKRVAFVTPGYLLLTSEVLWYPQTHTSYTPSVPGYQGRNFVNYTLQVKTKDGLTPISQGHVEQKGDNTYAFTPEQPLPQISLVVGSYENRSVNVDSTDYNFTTYEGHDYFVKYYDHVQDTLPEVIRILRKKVEQRVGWEYPFKRFSLVEVPATFHAYFKLSQNHQAYSQPEMVFMPEMGGEIFFADLRRFFDNIDRWRFEGQKVTDKKRQAHAAHDYLLQFLKSNYSVNTRQDIPEETQYYSIVPNMLWFTYDIQSKEWPLFAKNLDDHLNPVTANAGFFSQGQTLAEESNTTMKGKTMEEALSSEDNFTLKSQIIKSTGKTLMAQWQEQLGDAQINELFKDFLANRRFQSIPLTTFKNTVEEKYQTDFEPLIKAAYNNDQQPFYSFNKLESYAISIAGNQRYQVKFEVTNLSEVPGIVEIEIKSQTDDALIEQKAISLAPHQTKQWASVTNERPQLSINTLISQNIPQQITLNPSEFDLKPNATPIEGVSIISENSIKDLEIIVDNEDSGFYTIAENDPPLLQQLAFSDRNISEFKSIYRAPRGRWSKTSNNNYFGKHIRSAHFVRTGTGNKKAVWSTNMPEKGYYDIYAYSSTGEVWWNDEGKEQEVNHYIVHHADGEDEVSFDKKKEKGWVYLGSYYLNEGKNIVELTNKSEHRLVFADAVKWTQNDVISNK